MNVYTRDVMALLDLDPDTAQEVINEMASDGFDFSEATDAEFATWARYAHDTLISNQVG